MGAKSVRVVRHLRENRNAARLVAEAGDIPVVEQAVLPRGDPKRKQRVGTVVNANTDAGLSDAKVVAVVDAQGTIAPVILVGVDLRVGARGDRQCGGRHDSSLSK